MGICSVCRPPGNRNVDGYYGFGTDGGVFIQGSGNYHNSLPGLGVKATIVGGSVNFDNNGYAMIGTDGAVFAFGTQPNYNTAAHVPVSSQPAGIYNHPSNNGYWVLDGGGHVYAYGACGYYGNAGFGNATILIPRAQGDGYWIMSGTGQLQNFGAAPNLGSGVNVGGHGVCTTGESSPSGNGFTVCDYIGGVYTFGDATFENSLPGISATAPSFIVGLCCTGDGGGYIMSDYNGDIYSFGDAVYQGAL